MFEFVIAMVVVFVLGALFDSGARVNREASGGYQSPYGRHRPKKQTHRRADVPY